MDWFVFALSMLSASSSGAAEKEARVVELPLGSFSANRDGVRPSSKVQVAIVLVIEEGNMRHIRLDRSISEMGAPVKAGSSDSRTCPAVLEQMSKVKDLPMPTLVAPSAQEARRGQIMLHPTVYTLVMHGHESASDTDALVEITANSGSPVALWVDDTLSVLERCWSNPHIQ